MPMRRELYPANWDDISRQVRKDAGNRCEWCGVDNHAIGARSLNGIWYDEDDIHGMNSTDGMLLFGEFPDMIRIVLTVAHIDHNPANNDRSNLAALCQRWHLNHDRPHHMANAAATRARKRAEAIAATGQGSLL